MARVVVLPPAGATGRTSASDEGCSSGSAIDPLFNYPLRMREVLLILPMFVTTMLPSNTRTECILPDMCISGMIHYLLVFFVKMFLVFGEGVRLVGVTRAREFVFLMTTTSKPRDRMNQRSGGVDLLRWLAGVVRMKKRRGIHS